MIDVRSHRPDGYDDRHYLTLRGTGEMGDGQLVKVSLGESVVCGRSRWCEWSLKKTPRYLTDEGGVRERWKSGLPWRTTSRRHCRITYVAPDMVEVENLSANGTLVDGHRVDRIVLTDCRTVPHSIRLGVGGVELSLEPGALPVS